MTALRALPKLRGADYLGPRPSSKAQPTDLERVRLRATYREENARLRAAHLEALNEAEKCKQAHLESLEEIERVRGKLNREIDVLRGQLRILQEILERRVEPPKEPPGPKRWWHWRS